MSGADLSQRHTHARMLNTPAYDKVDCIEGASVVRRQMSVARQGLTLLNLVDTTIC